MAPSSLLKAEAEEEEATKRDKRRTGEGGGDKGEEKHSKKRDGEGEEKSRNCSRKNKHLQEKREKDRKGSRDAKEAKRGTDGGEGEKKEKVKKVKDAKGKKRCESGNSEKSSETQRERDADKSRGKRKEDKRDEHGASARLVDGEGEDAHMEERRGEKDEEERRKKTQKDTRGERDKRHAKEKSDRHSRTEKRKRCRSRERSKERKSSRGRHHERKDKKRGDNNRSESRRSHSRTLSRPSSAPSRSSSRETVGPEMAQRDSGRLASQTVDRQEKREKCGRSGSVRSVSRGSVSPSREGEKAGERSRTESPERADKQRRDSRKKEDCERRGRSRHHRHRHHRRDDKERGKKKRKRGSLSERSASRSSSASHKRDKSRRRKKHRRDRKRRHRDRRSPSGSSRSSSSRSDASRRSSQASATKREGDVSSQPSSTLHLSASPTSVIVPASGDNPGAPYTVPFSYLSLLASSLRSQQAAAKEASAQAEPSATVASAPVPPAASAAKPILGGIPPPPPTPPPPHVVAAAAAAASASSSFSSTAAASAPGAPTSALSLEEQLAAVKKEIEEEHARRTQEQQKELDVALEKRPETPLAVEISKESEAPEPQEASKETPENPPNPDENYNADERLGDAVGQLEDQEVVVAFAGPTADVHDPASLPLPVADVVGSERVLHSAILGNLLFLGFKRLMPVQRHSIPIGCAGYDICGSASTGSGKTLAFLVPMASRLLKMAPITRPFFPGPHAQASPTGLVLVPTRELALQIGEDIVRVCRGTGLTHILLIGGIPQKDQVDHITRQQIDIAVCTPGRLMDMCDLCKVSLSFVATLVLDEADVMLNMGFRSVIMSLLKDRDLPDSRQTMLFSATYPADLMNLLPMVFKPAYVRLSVGPANEAVPGTMNTAAKNNMVTQIVKHVEEPLKAAALRADLEEFLSANNSQAIVFVRSKRAIHPTAHTIRLAGIQTEVLTGNRTQPERQQVFRNFRDGRFPVLVATSIAARGLDFPNVGLVINVDMPQEMEHYVHRIGRTGRAGRPGVAISYMNWNDKKLAPAMIHILKQHDSEIPAFLQDMANDF